MAKPLLARVQIRPRLILLRLEPVLGQCGLREQGRFIGGRRQQCLERATRRKTPQGFHGANLAIAVDLHFNGFQHRLSPCIGL